MFTGIIEEVGTVLSIKKGNVSSKITFGGRKIFNDIHLGDSIAINGVCLTADILTDNSFTADIMAETLRRSSLGDLKVGSKVNMERAMLCNGRFGGHIVSGHVDATGKIINFKREENAVWITISTDGKALKYIVEKGSVALDGISLTVASVSDTSFKVSIIPHTASETTLLTKFIGDNINIECDVIGKYVEKFLNTKENTSNNSTLDLNFLANNGYI
ncbi:MAG: riboflavin synthase [Ruminococcus sp.]|nr:riboflavin synthase [Ruminococcus sp.]